ncbi:dolichyl-diphosphooligosaccharide-protein glycotransferase [Dictyostelium discoideum AX4]|uniref:Dolichyl-diphosphooligosaccharide--protein glycosyltransferase subunit 4 n=1 Tax=Dictyostelium discoideum TaxID=44689 RepID=OST4_DICDI|nr:dolichyl-diphosphooligosaccharide-protein glycotransferase [Dictyostelium discoideum AX4]Q54V54.1 RecName: Full=Dolichyl-diphosphooligosaccharide--protein glycosyltransferase subunit 4 [Dictyostelium discoideum]EAL67106.1 dolichyl-diphosphooligosaccharide-protein glycotransferase [Dictyostelium discoideum AX4]|eukprot:XP_641077.1 dolichyl-diphosphooligosaccharide-protein glycotransferase [Dictyostelium discoideum AX4]
MITDTQLTLLSNTLGATIFLLIVYYHYVATKTVTAAKKDN